MSSSSGGSPLREAGVRGWQQVAIALGAALALAGCSGSRLGKEDTAALAASCSWRGTWHLETVRCGEYSLPSWGQAYAEITMALVGDGEGCEATVTWSGPTCEEEEVWSFTPVPEGEMTVTRHGITSCEPTRCTFFPDDPEDATCRVRDRRGTITARVAASDDQTLDLVDLARFAWPGCSYGEGPGGANYLPLHTRWTR